MVAAGQQQMPWLDTMEGHGHARLGGDPQHLSRIAMHARGYVDRNHRQPGSPHAFDDRFGGAFERPGEASPKKSVHHQPGTRQHAGLKRSDVAAPGVRGSGSITRQVIPLAQQCYSDRPACPRQPTSDDEAVAAVVAGPAQHAHRRRGEAGQDGFGHGGACILHQLDARDAGRDRGRIRARHLRYLEDLAAEQHGRT